MRARLDLAYPECRLGIECDGERWHGGRIAFARDRARLAELATAGWRIVHVTWDDATRSPGLVSARVSTALTGSRGRGGRP